MWGSPVPVPDFTYLYGCLKVFRNQNSMAMKKMLFLVPVLFFLTASVTAQVHEYLSAENYGGKPQLREFIHEAMYYPEKARKNKTEGTVVVAFSVNRDGEVVDPRIKQSLSPETDAEALRLLRYLLFDAAQAKGAWIDEQKTMDFEFKLRKYKRYVKQRGYDRIEYPYQPVDSSLTIYKSRRLNQAPKPQYPNHSKSFTEFMMNHLKYPDAAVKQSISGTVELYFVVEPWGGISNLKVIEGVGAGCSEEAERLIRMLHWMPGIKDGKAVRTELQLSIKFSLSDFEQHRYVPANNANQI